MIGVLMYKRVVSILLAVQIFASSLPAMEMTQARSCCEVCSYLDRLKRAYVVLTTLALLVTAAGWGIAGHTAYQSKSSGSNIWDNFNFNAGLVVGSLGALLSVPLIYLTVRQYRMERW